MRRIAIEALESSPEELAHFRDLLRAGGVAAIPTETFYGLAADPRHSAGVERIVTAKGRGGDPLPVLVANRDQLRELGVNAPEDALEPFFRIWPAPLTVVLPLREALPASRGRKTLAVRVPSERRLRAILERTGPMTATSANRSGQPALDDPDAVAALFRDALDALVDGGQTPGGLPSTILDATQNPPRILRAGAYAWSGIGGGAC